MTKFLVCLHSLEKCGVSSWWLKNKLKTLAQANPVSATPGSLRDAFSAVKTRQALNEGLLGGVMTHDKRQLVVKALGDRAKAIREHAGALGEDWAKNQHTAKPLTNVARAAARPRARGVGKAIEAAKPKGYFHMDWATGDIRRWDDTHGLPHDVPRSTPVSKARIAKIPEDHKEHLAWVAGRTTPKVLKRMREEEAAAALRPGLRLEQRLELRPPRTKKASVEKTALLERIVRLGATPVKGTPRMFMRSRSRPELRALQHAVDDKWSKHVTEPILGAVGKHINKIPNQKIRKGLHWASTQIAEDPALLPLELAPIPGTAVAYKGLKAGLERAIDRIAPLR